MAPVAAGWPGATRGHHGSPGHDGAIRERPGAWCALRGFGAEGGGVGTQLLGILPEGGRDGGSAAGGEVRIEPCPGEYVASRGEAGSGYASSSTVPLLDRLP